MLQPIAGRLYRQKSLNIRRQLSIAHGVLDVSCATFRHGVLDAALHTGGNEGALSYVPMSDMGHSIPNAARIKSTL